jgi:hypothetical protein
MDIENISSVSITVSGMTYITSSDLGRAHAIGPFSYFFFKYTTVINMLSIFFYFVFIEHFPFDITQC